MKIFVYALTAGFSLLFACQTSNTTGTNNVIDEANPAGESKERDVSPPEPIKDREPTTTQQLKASPKKPVTKKP